MECLACKSKDLIKTKIGFEFEGGFPEGCKKEQEIKVRNKYWTYNTLNAYKCNECGLVMLYSEQGDKD